MSLGSVTYFSRCWDEGAAIRKHAQVEGRDFDDETEHALLLSPFRKIEVL